MKVVKWLSALLCAGLCPKPLAVVVQQSSGLHKQGSVKEWSESRHESQHHRQPMPTVRHEKEAGNGYKPGSPLYNKQAQQPEELKAAEGASIPPAAPPAEQSEACKLDYNYAWCMLIRYPISYLSGCLLHFGIIILIAYFYKLYKPSIYTPAKTFQSREDYWAYSLCSVKDCGEDLPICFMSWCCLNIRWADTVSSYKVMPDTFWTALVLLLICEFLAPLTAGLILIIFLGIFIYMRQRIRAAFGHQRGDCYTLTTDCLAWCCCPCCAAVQEAREVEKVVLPKVEAFTPAAAAATAPRQYAFSQTTQVAQVPQGGSPSMRSQGIVSAAATMPPTSMSSVPPTVGGSPPASQVQYPTLPK